MKSADVWSLGVTLYIFTYNRFPYEFRSNTDGKSMTEIDIMESIANVQLTFPENGREVSPELKDLLSMMLQREPEKRLSIAQIKAQSKFLNDQPVHHKRGNLLSTDSDSLSTADNGGLSSSSLQSMGSFNSTSLGSMTRESPMQQEDSFKLSLFNL
jgi:serine/threonine protein kinase